MPRRGENIFKRKDGRWEARYIRDYDVDGKAKYGFCYGKTYREAKEKVTSAKTQLMQTNQTGVTRSRQILSYYCDQWLEQHKTAVKPSTHAKYALILERYIKPEMGRYRLSTLSTETVEQFKNALLMERSLSAKTVRDTLMVLKMVFSFIRKQFPNGMREIEIVYPREQKQEMRVLTQEEQKVFVDYLTMEMDPCKFGVYLALTTGLRIGELCALQWKSISLQDRSVTVSATMQRVKNFDDSKGTKTTISFGAPKSGSSARKIPLTDYAVTLCKQFCPESAATFVLTGTASYMEPRTLQYRFKRYADDCGLKDVHFHTLRHTFATRCVEVGFEIKSLSEILGHANTSITLNRYVHSSMELKRRNMDKLSSVGL